MSRSRRGRDSRNRKKKAEESIEYLSSLILESDKDISNLAARDLLRVSKRHGVRAESKVRGLICRSCNSILRPGDGSRIRIHNGVRRLTCLECGRVHRSSLSKVE